MKTLINLSQRPSSQRTHTLMLEELLLWQSTIQALCQTLQEWWIRKVLFTNLCKKNRTLGWVKRCHTAHWTIQWMTKGTVASRYPYQEVQEVDQTTMTVVTKFNRLMIGNPCKTLVEDNMQLQIQSQFSTQRSFKKTKCWLSKTHSC